MPRSLAAIAAVLFVIAAAVDAACVGGKKGCILCSTDGSKCLQCKPGYGKHPRGKCVRCIDNACARCAGLDPSRCLACKPKFFRKGKYCKPCPAHCDSCENGTGKCKRCAPPSWDSTAYSWAPVYGATDSGKCKLCTPQGYHAGWCAACDGDWPSVCTKCVDYNNGFPMMTINGQCEFCTAMHVGCLQCENDTGHCLQCDSTSGYVPDGSGGCVSA